MKQLAQTTLIGLLMGAISASATLLVDVDGLSQVLTGATEFTVFEGSTGRMPQGGIAPDVRYESFGVVDTDIVAVIATGSTKIDYYLDLADISTSTLDAATHRYVKIDYSISGGDMVGIHKFRLGSTTYETGNAGNNFPFSNPELLNAAGGTAGSHSMIVDLQDFIDTANLADPVAGAGDWKYIRWNPFNSLDNDGITFTFDKITYGTGVAAVPEPSTAALALGLVVFTGLLIRRRLGRS